MASVGSAIHPNEQPWRVPSAPDVLSVFGIQNVLIVVWHKPASAAVVETLSELVTQLRAEHSTGMSFIHVGSAQFSLIDPATRDACVRILKSLKDYAATTAVIGKANGFLGSAARSVVTSVLAISRASTTIRFHERAEELFEWLPAEHKQRTGIELDIDPLRQLLLQAERL
jgi:hypothetical protein